MPSYQKLQCRLSAPHILVACDGGLQRKKINTDDHLSMCSCSGGTELDKAAKFRISRSAWCTFSRREQIRGYVHRENEHRGAPFRGWCTNSLANLCAGARLRGGGGGGDEYAVTPAPARILRMESSKSTSVRPVYRSPTRESRRAAKHRVEHEYELFWFHFWHAHSTNMPRKNLSPEQR